MNPLTWSTRQLIVVRAILTFAIAFMVAPQVHAGSMSLTVESAIPRWDSGEPVSPSRMTDLYIRLYGAKKGQPKVLLDAAHWAVSISFRRDSASTDIHCYAASLALDDDGDGLPDRESAQSAEWCGTFADPAPVLHLLPPDSIVGHAPAVP